jgi:hypothetical protein
MNTKQYVWRFFNLSLRQLAQKGLKQVTFKEMCELLQRIGNVYDNRTMKNYIDCMIDNGWVTEDNSENVYNPLSIFTDSKSLMIDYGATSNCIIIYKYTKFNTNENAKYDGIETKDILEDIINRKKKIAPTPPKES